MSENKLKINLIIIPISVDKGMAGTARLRNFIKYLPRENVSITNLVMGDENDEYEFMGTRILQLKTDPYTYFKQFRIVFRELKKLLKPGQKNILYYYDTPHTPLHFWLVRQARRKLGFTTVVDFVEDYKTYPLNLTWRGNMRVLFSGFIHRKVKWYADGAIGISTHLMDLFRKHFKNRPVVHLPVAFDPEALVMPQKTKNGHISLFYGGTFGEKDGMEFLIRGFEQAASKSPHITLHLTGKASRLDSKKFMDLMEETTVRERIINHGYVSYEEYCNILGSADVLLMTRRNSDFANAGFPFKLGEFLATGKPVIVSRLAEVEKYLDEQDCCFVTPESAEEIGKAITELQDENKREQIGRKGKEIAFRNFDARKVTNDLYEFLKTV